MKYLYSDGGHPSSTFRLDGKLLICQFRPAFERSEYTVGACIVSEDNKILSMGYNGLPRGCSDDEFPWSREGDPLDNKYLYTAHSELNAFLNYQGGTLQNAKMYVTLFPCNECAKAIIQAGIKTLVYDCDKYSDTASVIASKRMLNAAGVRYYKYDSTGRTVQIEL